jgi:phenylalanyl-tRNA synthetase beta chain
MKFSEHWLRTFVDPALSTGELADALTFGGIEVEAMAPAAPPFERVVVGEVVAVEKHPQADRLTVCRVKTGDGELTVVCGAPNVRSGIKVPLALPGAKLPGIEVQKAAVRGIESSGMLCSAKELGLSEEADGLLILPPEAKPGTSVRTLLDLDDQVLTTKPTPNRGDCLSLIGMAREVAAITRTPLKPIPDTKVAAATDKVFRVKVEAAQACPVYCGRLVQGVNAAAATPLWMEQRLARSGVRSINAVVDITNYVMLECGQPLHAFDAKRLEGGICVRFARAGETLELLNGTSPELRHDMLIIADDRKPVALAGIMGGAGTAVETSTSDIFIESAFFDPAVIAGKTRALGFASDSSFRFERGVDFAGTRCALDRATQLVMEICGGSAGPVSEARAATPERQPIRLRTERVTRLLGMQLTPADVREVLERLHFAHTADAAGFTVTPPSYRFDIAIEADLVEEVARIRGYDKIPLRMPVAAVTMLPAPESSRSASALRPALAARGYHEVVTYSFVDAGWEQDFSGRAEPILLANPIASHMNAMRSSLIGSLVDCVAFNVRHKQARIRVFEIGRCFIPEPGAIGQPLRVAAAAYGGAMEEQWGSPPRQVDFYDVKADVEALMAGAELTFEAAAHPAFHPGKSARITYRGAPAGWMGELHPHWQRKYDLPLAPVLFELDYNAVAQGSLPHYNEISKYPPVRRDLAAIFDDQISVQAILEGLNRHKPPIVAEISLFDVYRGTDVEKGKKSLAFRMLLQDTRKTLTDAEVESAVSGVRQVLQEQFNAKLR